MTLAIQGDSFASNLTVGIIVTVFSVMLGGIICVVRILLDEDKAALWRGRFYKLAFRVTGRLDREKKYISNDIKGRLNLARRKMHLVTISKGTIVPINIRRPFLRSHG